MTDAGTLRLSLSLALAGTLLLLTAIYGNHVLASIDYDLPRYETSRPALADWPNYSPRPRA